VGFFGGFIFDGSSWREYDLEGQRPDVAEPWLSVVVCDSDLAEVRYRPAGPGTGTAYLGCTPRTYFEDESASAPADVRREAAGLAWWAARQRAVHDQADLRELIASMLAADDGDPSAADSGSEDDDDDVGDVFVEDRVSRFLGAIGLPALELPGL
jgi:hypothetical protein